MVAFAYRCRKHDTMTIVEEGLLRGHVIPNCQECHDPMKRDYRAESVGVAFKGDGWARQDS